MDAIDARLYANTSKVNISPALSASRQAASANSTSEAANEASCEETFASAPTNVTGAAYSAQSLAGSQSPAASGPSFSFGIDADTSVERMEQLRKGGLADELRQVRKDLKVQRKELRESGSLADKAKVHGGLKDVDSAIERMELAHRASKWDSISSTVDGNVSSVYKSYFVNGQTPVNEMKQVLQTAKDLENPDSAQRLTGNSVQPLVREEIWQTKMDRLEQAANNPVVNGQPVEIDAEYYELASPEMIEKLGRAARGGAQVKVLMDPGQISRMSGTLDATSMASRLNTIKRLEEGSDGKAAVQLFANSEVLGGRDEIMHRKMLRVGDSVVFGGMNANNGSGENVDAGMEIKGTGAGRYVEVFGQDVELSRGRSVEQIYGKHMSDLRNNEEIVVQPRGVIDLIEAQLPGGARGSESYSQRAERVLDSAAFAGIVPSELAEIPDSDGDGVVTSADERAFLIGGRGDVKLTEKGRTMLADGLTSAVDRMNSKSNQDRLQDISSPSAAVAGSETTAVGNTSVERQAMLLHAIDTAEEHINVSAFVLNEDIARVLVEKKESMEAQGKPFDVKVVLDPGVYGYGGSPNESAYKYLEDAGVDVHWAALDRSSADHDRKVHAKLMLTDKMMVAGSTNFSQKGLRNNWELSNTTFFDNEGSQASKAKMEADFQKLWEQESLGIDTKAIAEKKHGDVTGLEGEYLRDSERTTTVRKFLRGIGNLEKEIGKEVEGLVQADPILSYNVAQQVRQGSAEGYAVLNAVGDDKLAEIRHGSKAWKSLQDLRNGN